MTGMQRLMEELRRHAADYERATDPDRQRRALHRFRIAFLLGNRSLGVRESAGDDEVQWSGGGTIAFPTDRIAARGESEDVTASRTESVSWSRTTGHSGTCSVPAIGSSDTVGRSVPVGGCRHCAHRARELEVRSTARMLRVVLSHGGWIIGGGSVSVTPSEPQTRGENEMSADERDEVSEWLIAFLEAGSDYDATATLRESMDVGASHANVRVRDGAGAEHGSGSPHYERVFLAALKQHVAEGEIEPVFADEAQRADWVSWLGGAEAPVVDIPLRFCGTTAPAPEVRSPLELARAHLMEILAGEGTVRYSRFYNPNPDPEAGLRVLFGLERESDSAAVLMDDAVWDLKQAGLVTTADLPERLMDGNPDYLIELTEKGRSAVAEDRAHTPRQASE